MVGKCQAKPDRHSGTAQPCTILSILCWLHHEVVVTHGPRARVKLLALAGTGDMVTAQVSSPHLPQTDQPMADPHQLPLPRSQGLAVAVSPITLQSLRESSCCSPCNLSPSPGTDMLCFCPPALCSPSAKAWWKQIEHGRNRPHPLPSALHDVISGFCHFPHHPTSTSPAP